MNRMVRPIMFAFEPDVVFVFARVTFGAAGAPTLDTKNSKGICNVALNSASFTATTATSTTLSVVSSFAGLYVGQIVSGAGVQAGSTIVSLNPGAGTLVLSLATTASAAGVAMTASGGGYTFTFGSQFTPFKRLDTYVKLLNVDATFDESGVQGGVGVGALAPAGADMFVSNNSISNAALASVGVQFGNGISGGFVAANPASGEAVEMAFCLCRSTAI